MNAKQRNIAIIAHVDSGKTSLTERILYYAGKIHRMGEVHHGASTMDTMKQERERGITIASAATTIGWQEHSVNIIDTPGHIDFNQNVEQSLRVLDGAVLVLDAVAGVQPQTETVWRQAGRYGVPALVFVNKMDRVGATREMAPRTLKSRLGLESLCVNLPIGQESDLVGILDLVTGEAWSFPDDGSHPQKLDLTADLQADLHAGQAELWEKLASVDDGFVEDYFTYLDDGTAPSEASVRAAVKRSVQSHSAVALFYGSALKNIGVQMLMDGVTEYLPHPVSHGSDPLALIFKVTVQGSKRYAWARVYGGHFEPGIKITNLRTRNMERIGRILQMHADKVSDLTKADAGSIVAFVGLKDMRAGDTLGMKGATPLAEMHVPEPTIRMSVEARTREAQDKLTEALTAFALEDPSFRFSTDEETGQLLMQGMGELHLEIIADRLKTERNLDIRTGQPQVAYRYQLSGPAKGIEGKVKRQTGGSGAFARVIMDFEVGENGFEFHDEVKGGTVPREFIPSVEKGVRAWTEAGADYPVMNLIARLRDGSYHAVDSSDFAFREAGQLACDAAVEAVGLTLMEPIVEAEIVCPEDNFGAVMGDVQKRRGIILGSEVQDGEACLTVRIPLSETFGYITALRTLTQGRGHATMAPAGYERALVKV